MNTPYLIPPLALFEAHPIRLLIQDRLRRVQPGEMIPYGAIDALVGFDVREHAPHLLQYAKDALIDEGIVFDTIVGEGIKRATPSNAVAIAEGQASRAANAAAKGARIIKSIDLEALAPGERIRFGIAQIRIGVMQQFNRPTVGRKLGKALEAGSRPAQLSGAIVGSLKQFN
jgi:hypothetical protein